MANPNNNSSYWSELGILNRVFSEGDGALNVGMTSNNSGISSVASSATAVTLHTANTKRKQILITNESTANLYVSLGQTASLTVYTVKLAPGAYYESPAGGYNGIISGIWDAANGFARVTELT